MSFTLDTSVVDLFRSTTASSDSSPDIRALLVQSSPTAKKLELTKQLPPRSSDKEDFETSLPSLFDEEPTRSGYALFRLDSQAANGDWEWLCVAYQPDGARVKEKMQYTATRTALMGALDEHRFLDTIYSAGPRDFTFPTKLRNARKHDYQNPQQKTAGRPAAEAAGTDAGGARRMFGGRAAAPVSTPKDVQSEAASFKTVDNAAKTSAAPLAAMEAAAPPANTQEDSPNAPIAPSVSGLPAADPSDVVAGREAAAEEEAKAAEPAPAAEAAPAPTPKIATPDLPSEAQEQAVEESKAPEEPSTPAPVAAESSKPEEAAQEELSKPLVPSPETAKRQLTEGEHSKSNGEVANVEVSKAKPEEQLAKEERKEAAPKKVESASAAATKAAASSSSSAAASFAAPPPSSSSAPPPAGAAGGSSSSRPAPTISRPLEWPADVEAALSGLATRVSGSSEHNFVPLHLDVTSRSISLTSDSPPRFLPPGDLSESVRNEASAVDGEEATLALAVYRYPIEVNARKVAFLYSSHGGQQVPPSLRAKLLDEVQDRVAELSGLEIERASLPGSGGGEEGASGSAGAGAAAAEYGPYPRPSPAQAEEVASRITEIQRRVDSAASSSTTTSPSKPRLVAVSKLHPPSSIMAAHIRCHHAHFGENYVQELVDKARVLPRSIKWHFVGGLQSNKAKVLAGVPNLFCLETLDSVKAAGALQKALSAGGGEVMREREECGLGPLKVFIQVNTSGEEAKSGVKLPTQGEENGELEALARHILTECPSLHLAGLMTIGSAANSKAASADGKTLSKEEALEANPDFKALHDARASLVKALRASPPTLASSSDGSKDDAEQAQGYETLLKGEGDDGGLELSMGMTADFEVAIAAGSGNVRVGTACFGQRPGSREEARKGMEGELQQARPTEREEGAKAGASGVGGGVVGEKGFARPKRPGGGKK